MIWRDQVKDIGTLKGPVLVFGGVYSNLQALEKLIALAEKEEVPPANIICTGDMVGYCAQPAAVLDKIKEWGIHVILGNVEIQLKEGEEDCGCNFDEGSRCDAFSRQWYPYAQNEVRTDQVEWLHTLPDFLRFEYAGKETFVLHGGLENTSEFIFRSTSRERKLEIMNELQADVVLGGHCGLPFHDMFDERAWLNPGVIGMPANDGTTRVWYMLLNDEKGLQFEHRSFQYDHDLAQQLMIDKNLPLSYAKTLGSGIWDNCEILPEEETSQQGVEISFS